MSRHVILVNIISELLSVGSNPLPDVRSKVWVVLLISIGIIPFKINWNLQSGTWESVGQ